MNETNLKSGKSIWKHLQIGFRYPIIWCVLIPWLIVCSYILWVKTPVYEGVITLFFHEQVGSMPANKWFSLLNKKQEARSYGDSNLVYLMQKHIYSRAMINKIQSDLDLKGHYQNPNIDFLSKLNKNASDREFIEYYRKKIEVALDRNTNELIVKVHTFSQEMTSQLTASIEKNMLDFYNNMNNQLIEKQKLVAIAALKSATNKFFKQKKILGTAQAASVNESTIPHIESEKFKLKIAQKEYESAYEAYMIWQITTEKNTPVVTTGFSEIEPISYPRIPYDLISILVFFLVAFSLLKMMYIVVLEHLE